VPGLSFTVDGKNYTGTQTFSWAVTSQHTWNTTATQAGSAGTQYVFTGWSNGTMTTVDYVTASSDTLSYTADFQTQYQLTTGVNLSLAGTVSPASGTYYNAGTIVHLGASAKPGYKFLNWTGNVANPSSASTTVTMNQPQNVVADFAVQVVFARIPSATVVGPTFFVDGAGYNRTPSTFWWLPGSAHKVGTNSPQTVNGTTYTFVKWSDGGAEDHSVTAPTTPTTYTVTFKTK